MNQRSLRTKLIVFFILFALIPAAIGGAISIYMNITSTKSAAVQSNSNTAAQVAKQIEIMLDDSKGMVEGLAVSPTVRSMDGPGIRDMIMGIQEKNPQFELIYVMNNTGMQIARTSGALANRGEREYFKEAEKGGTFFSDSYISFFTNGPCVTISTPIKNWNGAIIGVLAADISFEALKGITETFKMGKNGYIEIVDNLGTVIAHPDHERVLNKESFANLEYVQKVIKGQLGWVEGVSTRGEKSIISFAPSAKYKWGIIVNQPAKEIFDVAIFTTSIVVAILLISVLLATVVAFYIVSGIVIPLEKVVKAVERIAEGDLSQTIAVKGVLEVNQLVQGVNHMATSLRKIIIHTASVAESVAASAEELTATATDVSSKARTVHVATQSPTRSASKKNKLSKGATKFDMNNEEQKTSVHEIATAASGLATMAVELQEIVSKFKV